MAKVGCPHCDQIVEAPGVPGEIKPCPACHGPFQVPVPTAAPLPASGSEADSEQSLCERVFGRPSLMWIWDVFIALITAVSVLAIPIALLGEALGNGRVLLLASAVGALVPCAIYHAVRDLKA